MRRAVAGAGELLITAGVMLLLFCVYQLVWTNVEAHRAQQALVRELDDDWRRGSGDPPSAATVAESGRARTEPRHEPRPGAVVALVHIPRLGTDYRKPVVEGVDADDLARGVGHYPDTALPGEVGNFAVAGHRATNGEPFRDLDQLRRGDAIVIETRDRWLTYSVERVEIVEPTRREVIAAVPGRPGAKPTKRLLTLTTCHPRWSSAQRLVVHAALESERPRALGRPTVLGK